MLVLSLSIIFHSLRFAKKIYCEFNFCLSFVIIFEYFHVFFVLAI